MTDDPIRYEVRDTTAWITLNRPRALNALNRDLRGRLPEALACAADDAAVRAVVIAGAGERAFSAGADITEFNSPSALGPEPAEGAGARWHEAPTLCPKPAIAAIRGFCLGGGLELALACDIRICTPDAQFGLPEVGLGIIPGGGGTQRLPRLLGAGPALHLILTGERIDAQEALRLGLVSRIVDPGALAAEAEVLANRLAENGALALACAKAAVQRGLGLPLDAGLAIEAELLGRVMASEERAERAEAFMARQRGAA